MKDYKLIFATICMVVMILALVRGCENENALQISNAKIDEILTEHATERNRLEQEISSYKEHIMAADSLHRATLLAYQNKSAKERIKDITKIDSSAVTTDSNATLSLAGIDSINKLSFAYQNCVVKSAIKDSIIATQDTIIRKDSIALASIVEQYKKDVKKASAKSFRKGFGYGGVLGLLIGLVIH